MCLREIITWTRYLNTTEFGPALRMAPHPPRFRALAAFTFRTRNFWFLVLNIGPETALPSRLHFSESVSHSLISSVRWLPASPDVPLDVDLTCALNSLASPTDTDNSDIDVRSIRPIGVDHMTRHRAGAHAAIVGALKNTARDHCLERR